MKLTAQDVMTRHVVTVTPETAVEDVAAQLARHRITGLPVLDDGGAVIGMVNDFDVIGKKGRTVHEIMSTQVISVSPDTDLDEVSHILIGKHTSRVPVIQGGALVGIVSRSDLIKRIAQRWTCTVCGALANGPMAPEHCNGCGADGARFSLVDEPPMMYRDM